MRQIVLRTETLFTILFITAVAMFLIGIIAFKITERFALQGKIEGARSIIAAFEALYAKDGNVENSANFLKDALEPGAWGVIADSHARSGFYTDSTRSVGSVTDPLILEVIRSERTVIDLEGIDIPPFHSI